MQQNTNENIIFGFCMSFLVLWLNLFIYIFILSFFFKQHRLFKLMFQFEFSNKKKLDELNTKCSKTNVKKRFRVPYCLAQITPKVYFDTNILKLQTKIIQKIQPKNARNWLKKIRQVYSRQISSVGKTVLMNVLQNRWKARLKKKQ